MKTVFEFENYRKLVEFGIFVLRAVSDELRDLAELKTHHIQKVDRRFIQKSACHIRIACPNRIFQFAAIHFDMRRMGRLQIIVLSILHRRGQNDDYVRPEKPCPSRLRFSSSFFASSIPIANGFSAKNVFSRRYRIRSYFSVVLFGAHTRTASQFSKSSSATYRPFRRLSLPCAPLFPAQCHKSAEISCPMYLRINPSVNVADITRSDNPDLNFSIIFIDK